MLNTEKQSYGAAAISSCCTVRSQGLAFFPLGQKLQVILAHTHEAKIALSQSHGFRKNSKKLSNS